MTDLIGPSPENCTSADGLFSFNRSLHYSCRNPIVCVFATKNKLILRIANYFCNKMRRKFPNSKKDFFFCNLSFYSDSDRMYEFSRDLREIKNKIESLMFSATPNRAYTRAVRFEHGKFFVGLEEFTEASFIKPTSADLKTFQKKEPFLCL